MLKTIIKCNCNNHSQICQNVLFSTNSLCKQAIVRRELFISLVFNSCMVIPLILLTDIFCLWIFLGALKSE